MRVLSYKSSTYFLSILTRSPGVTQIIFAYFPRCLSASGRSSSRSWPLSKYMLRSSDTPLWKLFHPGSPSDAQVLIRVFFISCASSGPASCKNPG